MDNNGSKVITDKDLEQLTNDEVIDYFVRGIMAEKGINAPTPEIEEDIFKDLRAKLLEEIDRSLIAELPEADLDKLEKLATENKQIDPQMVTKMIEDAHLNVVEITGVTMQRFREIYLGLNTEGEKE